MNYDTPYQTSLISMLLSDPTAWQTCSSHFKDEYFDDGLRIAVRYIAKYYEEYGKMPAVEQITANTHGVEIPKFSEPVEHTEATIDDFEGFIKYRAMENLVLDGIDFIQKGNVAELAAKIHDASEIQVRATEHPFDGLWIDECQDVEPPIFLISDWLVQDTVTCIYGAPGAYKTYFMLEAGFCLAAGVPFAGKPVHQTSVAYVAAEGQRGLAMRLEALSEAHQVVPDRNSFRLITQPLNLLDDEAVTCFIRYLFDLEKREKIDFGLVVLDTYSQCISGADENSQAVASKASSAMIRIRRELETTLVYVHHTGKDESRGMRGSDALRANTDGAIEIVRDDEDSPFATAIVKRSKDAPTGRRVRFKMTFQKIRRLSGHKFGGSLVPEFLDEVAIVGTPLPKSGRTITPLEDVLNHITEGQVCSVANVLKMIGQAANKHYKDKLAALLPFDVAMPVHNTDSDLIGILARIQSARADNQYGDIKCLSKEGNKGNTP